MHQRARDKMEEKNIDDKTDFNGKWTVYKSENFEEVMIAQGKSIFRVFACCCQYML